MTDRKEQLNQSPEEFVLQVLTQQLTPSEPVAPTESDPLLKLIGSLEVDIPDLAENHDYYVGRSLY